MDTSPNQPFADLVGIETEDGRTVVRTTAEHANRNGAVHGGLTATLVDIAMGTPVRETLDGGQGAATLQMSLTYLNPAKPGDTLLATAEVGKRGADVVLLTCSVVTEGGTEDGTDIAEAVGTYTILDVD